MTNANPGTRRASKRARRRDQRVENGGSAAVENCRAVQSSEKVDDRQTAESRFCSLGDAVACDGKRPQAGRLVRGRIHGGGRVQETELWRLAESDGRDI